MDPDFQSGLSGGVAVSTGEFLLTAWSARPFVLIGCFALMALYLWVAKRLGPRLLAWSGGVALILIALVSPLDRLADTYLFSAHMAKHILFVLVIPALLLIGTPPSLVERSLRFPAARAAARLLSAPAVTWPAGIGAMILWHIPAVFSAASLHESLHTVEHVSLLVGGVMFWWPILAPLPRLRLRPVPQGVAYLFTACLACTMMGVLITFSPVILYPAYLNPPDPDGVLLLIRNGWGMTPALDQQVGGLLMWVPCCLVYLTAIMTMFGRWYGADESMEAQWI
jgi:cytochrome c oxidase assembly factor CtaG